MKNHNAGAGNCFRNILSRVRSHENQQPSHPSSPPPSATAPTTRARPTIPPQLRIPQDPFNVHPGEPLLSETDFRSPKESVFFRARTNEIDGRAHRPIPQQRSRSSPELSRRSKKIPDCSRIRTREKDIVEMDPYHQYAYDTRAHAPELAVCVLNHDLADGELEGDSGRQRKPATILRFIDFCSRTRTCGRQNI